MDKKFTLLFFHKLLILIVLTVAFQSCSNREADYDQIKKAIDVINKMPDKNKATQLHTKIETFIKKYPNDTMIPLLKFEDSRFLINPLADYPKAIASLESIYKLYPDHRVAPLALQLLAFTYDETLKDYQKASKTYRILIDKYPNHPAGKEAALLLQLLGKDLNEIIKGNSP